jgi:hypothetical protein
MTCRYRFISAHAGQYKVKRLCRVLGVHRSGYTTWVAAAEARAARATADAQLAEQIRAAHAASRGTYGVRRIHAELAAEAESGGADPVNHKRIERVMREHRITGRHRRRRVVTTVPDPGACTIPDLVKRAFTASRPDEKWCGSGSRRDSHPPAPTEPCVIVSPYTAPATLITRNCGTNASGRTFQGIFV